MPSSEDVLIVGGGLSGQLAAYLLSRKGYSVTLCEAEEKLGGRARVDYPLGMPIDFGLHFNLILPEQAKKLDLSLSWRFVSQKTPLYFENKVWHPAARDMLTPEQQLFYLIDMVFPQGGVGALLAPLTAASNITVKLNCPLSECAFEETVIKEMAGAKERWEAKAFVMAMPFYEMEKVIPKNNIHQKVLKRFKKQTFVSAIKLDFILKSKISEQTAVLYDLEGRGVGFFPTNADETLSADGRAIAQWLFFLTAAESTSKEEIAKRIRYGRRFLKKAFPSFFENLLWERIGVISALFPAAPITEPIEKEWTSLKNLFWVSDMLGGPASGGNRLVENVIQEVGKADLYLKSMP